MLNTLGSRTEPVTFKWIKWFNPIILINTLGSRTEPVTFKWIKWFYPIILLNTFGSRTEPVTFNWIKWFNPIIFVEDYPLLMQIYEIWPELKTLVLWISRSLLDLFFANLQINSFFKLISRKVYKVHLIRVCLQKPNS